VNATEHPAAGACPSRAARRRLAGALGLTGGLGIAAGIIQAVAGSRIPAWTGGKASPVPLGLLTIVFSAVALACGLGLLAKPASPGRCAALAAGLVIPAGICFSTVGMLWYLPGTLLLAATVIAVLAGPPAGVVAAVRHNWLRVLISVLGGYEILLALGAGAATAVLGLTGGAGADRRALGRAAVPGPRGGPPRGRHHAVRARHVVEPHRPRRSPPRPRHRAALDAGGTGTPRPAPQSRASGRQATRAHRHDHRRARAMTPVGFQNSATSVGLGFYAARS